MFLLGSKSETYVNFGLVINCDFTRCAGSGGNKCCMNTITQITTA